MTLNVTFRGVKLSVAYHYQPAERMTNDYPGCDEEIEVEAVYTLHGDDIAELLVDCMDELEEVCLEGYHDEYAAEWSSTLGWNGRT